MAGRKISIENLNYPFEWVEEIVRDFKFAICMDIGHLIVCGADINTFFNSYYGNISIMHLHGVENGRDHLSLERLPEERVGEIIEILNKFTKTVSIEVIEILNKYNKTVSIEVFSYDALKSSLEFLEKCWNKFNGVLKNL